jgi:hypothetical protein
MGLDINTFERLGAWGISAQPPDYYGVNYLHDRLHTLGEGYAALHFYPLSILRFELLSELGTSAVKAQGTNVWGVRPVGIFDIGWLKLKAGCEYEKNTYTTTVPNPDPSIVGKVDSAYKQTRKGYGVALQFVFDPYVEFGFNIAQGFQSVNNPDSLTMNSTNSFTVTSAGGFANVRLGPRDSVLGDFLLGSGVDWTTWYDHLSVSGAPVDYTAQLQVFGALQYLVAKQLFVKLVVAYARADFEPSGSSGSDIYSNVMWSGRVRLMYLY